MGARGRKVHDENKRYFRYKGKIYEYYVDIIKGKDVISKTEYNRIKKKLGLESATNATINKIIEGYDTYAINTKGEVLKLNSKVNYSNILKNFRDRSTYTNKKATGKNPDTTIDRVGRKKSPKEEKKGNIIYSNVLIPPNPRGFTGLKIRARVPFGGSTDREVSHLYPEETTYREVVDDILYNESVGNEPVIVKEFVFDYNGKIEDGRNILAHINLEIMRYLGDKETFGPLTFKRTKLVKYDVLDIKYNHLRTSYGDVYIRDSENEYLLSEWSNLIKVEATKEDTCVAAYIKQAFPQFYKEFKTIETPEGMKISDIESKLQELRISYIFYDVRGKILIRWDDGDDGMLTAIMYNNHIYPVKNVKLKKRKTKVKDVIMKEDINEDFNNYLKNKILPSLSSIKFKFDKINVETNTVTVSIKEFECLKTKYVKNDKHDHYYNLLKKIIMKEKFNDAKIPSSLDENNFIKVLEKVYGYDVESYVPDIAKYKRTPFLYKSGIATDKKIHTDDKNKCYSYALQTLPFLIKHDYRYHDVKQYEDEEIVDHYLYLVKPKEYSLLFPEDGIYPGYFIAGYKSQLEITEVMECEKVINYFTTLIPLMYEHMSEAEFKITVNKMIGKFECIPSEKNTYRIRTIIPKDKKDQESGWYTEFGDHLIFFNEVTCINNVMSRLPISLQVKDQARLMLCERISKLGLSNDDIIQINTDSISYINKSPLNDYTKDIEGWKKSEYKEINNQYYEQEMIPSLIRARNKRDVFRPRKEYPMVKGLDPDNNKEPLKVYRKLYNQYAGCGKTTTIMSIVKELTKEGRSHIILTPTHETLNECRKMAKEKNLTINCDIIHRYLYSYKTGISDIPKEDVVIIDEVGLLDRNGNNFLLKLYHMRKQYVCFGDYNQLSLDPIQYNKPHYFHMIFDEIDTTFNNRRNKFTKFFYDDLIENLNQNYVKKVKRYSTAEYYEAELIIAYENKTVDKYNELMLKRNNMEFSKEYISPGLYVVCNSNELLVKGICNGMKALIADVSKDCKTIYMYIDNDIIELSKSEVLRCFKPAFAMTACKTQGKTLKSYYWCEEDNKYLRPNDCIPHNKLAYTIISRLKQE